MTKLQLTKKYETYPEYKDSGVEWLGSVPVSWDQSIIQRHFTKVKRVGFKEEQLLSVYRGLGVIVKSSRDDNHNKASEDLSTYQLVNPGDLAINKMKAWQGSLAVSDLRGIVSPAYYICKPISGINSRFIHYLLRSDLYIKQYERYSGGVRNDQWDLSYERFRKIQVVIPSTGEQEKIAAYLDEKTALIDAIIEKKQRLIELLQEKRTAVINHAVTKGLDPNVEFVDSGVDWIGRIPADWQETLLRKVVNENNVKNTLGNNQNLLSLSYGRVIQKNINTLGGLLPSSFNTYQVVKRGDVIIRPTDLQNDKKSLRVGYVEDENGIITSAYMRLQVNYKFLSKFIYYVLSSYDFQKIFYRIGGGVRQSLDFRSLKYLPVFLPSMSKQNEIVTFLDEKNTSNARNIELIENSILLFEEFKSSLISHVVTGKIKV